MRVLGTTARDLRGAGYDHVYEGMVQAVEGLRRWDRVLVELSALSQVYQWYRRSRAAVEAAQVAQAEAVAATEEAVARANANAEARRARKKRARTRKREMARRYGAGGAETTDFEVRAAVACEADDWEESSSDGSLGEYYRRKWGWGTQEEEEEERALQAAAVTVQARVAGQVARAKVARMQERERRLQLVRLQSRTRLKAVVLARWVQVMVQYELFAMELREVAGMVEFVDWQEETGRPAVCISTLGWECWAEENRARVEASFKALVSENMTGSGGWLQDSPVDPTLDPRLLRYRQVSEQCRMVWGSREVHPIGGPMGERGVPKSCSLHTHW